MRYLLMLLFISSCVSTKLPPQPPEAGGLSGNNDTIQVDFDSDGVLDYFDEEPYTYDNAEGSGSDLLYFDETYVEEAAVESVEMYEEAAMDVYPIIEAIEVHEEAVMDVPVEEMTMPLEELASPPNIVAINAPNIVIDESVLERLESESSALEIPVESVEMAPMPVPSNKGSMTYSIEDTMKVGISYPVKLRISRILQRAAIEAGLPNPVTSSIKTSEVMEVLLFDPDPVKEDQNFTILPITRAEQFVDNDSSWTEWAWEVKPIKGGSHTLKLVINMRKQTEFGPQVKSIKVFEELITIESSASYSVSTWLRKHWQWFLGTLGIPFIIFLYKKRKERQEA